MTDRSTMTNTIPHLQSRAHYLLQTYPVFSVVAIVLLFFIFGRVIKQIYANIVNERQIQRLGGHAPKRSSWVPFNLDFTYKAIKLNMRYEDEKLWYTMFGESGNPNLPWTIEMDVLALRLIFTVDEENLKAVLATQFGDFGKGEVFNKEWHDFLGDSIFTTDGDRWHQSRQLIRPQFIKDRVSDLKVFESHASVLVPMLAGHQPGQPVNVVDLFFRYTLDAATDFLLGQSVESLRNPRQRFADAFGEVQRVQSLIARAGPLNPLIGRKSFFANLKVMEDFIQPMIERTLRLSPEELEKRTKSDEGYTFLHALASYTRDRKVLRDQITAVLLAGRDTTACTLSWMFYELSRQPDIVRKLREEVLAQVGKDKIPTYADLKSMRYLQHTINETLRLYPIVPYNVRVALKDTTLPHGGGADGRQPIGILAGTPVAYSSIIMQRREDIYPPVSEKFPHRLTFAPGRWDHWTPKTWTYIPFNGGPRICKYIMSVGRLSLTCPGVGQQFALTEIAYTTVRILQKYSRIECRMSQELRQKAEIVLQPADGVNLAFWEDGA